MITMEEKKVVEREQTEELRTDYKLEWLSYSFWNNKCQLLNAQNWSFVFKALWHLSMDVFYMCTFYEEGRWTLQSARKQFTD